MSSSRPRCAAVRFRAGIQSLLLLLFAAAALTGMKVIEATGAEDAVRMAQSSNAHVNSEQQLERGTTEYGDYADYAQQAVDDDEGETSAELKEKEEGEEAHAGVGAGEEDEEEEEEDEDEEEDGEGEGEEESSKVVLERLGEHSHELMARTATMK